jgi:integrase
VPLEKIPHVKRVVVRGKSYYYFNTGKFDAKHNPIRVALPDIKDPAFWPRYGSLKAGRTRRANREAQWTVPALCEAYRRSPQYCDLAESSRALYGLTLNRLAKLLPTAPANEVNHADMRELLDGLHETPGAANALLRVTSALYLWGRRAGHVTVEPCRDVKPYVLGEHDPWTEEQVEAGLAASDPVARLGVHMLLYTAQRIGDVSKARWSDLRGGVWQMTQGKTKKPMVIRLHRNLVAELARHAPQGPFLFTSRRGAVMKVEVLRDAIQRAVPGVVPHGLRKNAVVALLEAGCSVAETAAMSGQSLQMVEHYAKARDQRMLSSAAVLQWERKIIST